MFVAQARVLEGNARLAPDLADIEILVSRLLTAARRQRRLALFDRRHVVRRSVLLLQVVSGHTMVVDDGGLDARLSVGWENAGLVLSERTRWREEATGEVCAPDDVNTDDEKSFDSVSVVALFTRDLI